MQNNTRSSLRYMTKVAVLAAMAAALYFLEFPLPFLAPSFYKIDMSDLPALIGSFALGPTAGVLIELIKNLVHLSVSTTQYVGEFANFVTGCAFILPAAFLYRRKKGIKTALVGMAIGTFSLVLVGGLLNYFVLIPAFSQIYGMPLEAIVAAGGAINPWIDNLPMMIVLAVMPFNLVKGVLCSVLTLLLYKRVSPLLHK